MAAPTPARTLWKGSISFGLVFIPIALHSATVEVRPKMRMLDVDTGAPVGYQKIDKSTGEAISQQQVVKGVEVDAGQYVTLTKDEIREALPKTTQTIEIESFVPNTDIPFVYLERPYYIAPINKGKKVYALLRDTLLKTQRVGIARVVIQTKQHLAVLVPSGPGLILNLLRWGADIRSWEDLDLPAEGAKAAGLSDKELSMAKQLVDDMTGKWQPDQFSDSFKDDIMALVKQKVKEGKVETVEQPEADEESTGPSGANIIDLTELLQRSLRNKGGATKADTPDTKTPAKKAAAKATRKPAAEAAPARRKVA